MDKIQDNIQDNIDSDESIPIGAIAIIGMNGRFPGAKNMDSFWENLCEGVESVKFFSREELIEMGIDEHLLDNPRFVAADAVLDDMDKFDASFFDYSAREAEIMDPQHRLFLESAWEVLESAGYSSELYKGRIAVYAGANLSGYMLRNIYSNPGLVENLGSFKIMIANSQDFLATRVSYKMDLKGPSVNVNTLCSSSIVALHMGCQNLQNYSCDLALAGGVSFQISRNEAFFYQEGGIGSGDGHCRAYDAGANGTVSGSGLGVVVLKRLEDAIADGDHIHAVIRGIGINNDGSQKNSYTAPNVDGQAECIAEAIAMSGVNPETITYIDGHGTGTDLGDPIEISALTKAFCAYTDKKQFCAIGSVKTNIGHLVTAGGLASLCKTVLAMQHRMIPPSLNFEKANPKIDFLNSPFYVNRTLSPWEADELPLRGAISSFGIGGTNTHVILEEAPIMAPSSPARRPWNLVVLSAKTGTALKTMTENLSEYIRKNSSLNAADVAFTLQVGRRNFNHRRILVCRDTTDLMERLENMEDGKVLTRFEKTKEQPVVFVFHGEESKYAGIGAEIYRTEPVYRIIVDECAEVVEKLVGFDIRSRLYHLSPECVNADGRFNEEITNRVAAFITGYALAKLWMSWEVEPEIMIGEGVGEYAAACTSGVMMLQDALKMVCTRDDELFETLKNITFHSQKVSLVSSVTGRRIDAQEASKPEYWISQRAAVRFKNGLEDICKDPDQILLEMGSGSRNCDEVYAKYKEAGPEIISSLGHNDGNSDSYNILIGVGQFWLAGGRLDWNKMYQEEKRCRIPLPTYPFERQSYWIEPGRRHQSTEQMLTIEKKEDITGTVLNTKYTEGTIRIALNFKKESNSVGKNERSKEELEEALLFKQRLEEFCSNYGEISSDITVSPVNLNVPRAPGGDVRLDKRPRPQMDEPYVEPRNETERIIAECWQEVLGYEKVGVKDNFFVLGGHSLIAASIASELEKVFKVQIPLAQIFEASTVEEISVVVDNYRWALDNSAAVAESEEFENGTI